MNIYEFGKENKEIILLIHPAMVKWDYFHLVIPLLQNHYHLIIPALPGYDLDNNSDFEGVEKTASDLGDWLVSQGYDELYAVYGCSMGGSMSLLVTIGQKVKVKHCIMDGGITPYQLPWIITRVIAVKDFLMIKMGKIGGVGLLEKAFATDHYTKEDLQYIVDLLNHCSNKTIWCSFESCNNYKMPKVIPQLDTTIHYWYAEGEKKERKLDIEYMAKRFPSTQFKALPDLGHGGLVLRKPDLFVDLITNL